MKTLLIIILGAVMCASFAPAQSLSLLPKEEELAQALQALDRPWTLEGDILFLKYTEAMAERARDEGGAEKGIRVFVIMTALRLAWVSGLTDRPLRDDLQTTRTGEVVQQALALQDKGTDARIIVNALNQVINEKLRARMETQP